MGHVKNLSFAKSGLNSITDYSNEKSDDIESCRPTSLNYQKSSNGNIPHFCIDSASGSRGYKEFIQNTLGAQPVSRYKKLY